MEDKKIVEALQYLASRDMHDDPKYMNSVLYIVEYLNSVSEEMVKIEESFKAIQDLANKLTSKIEGENTDEE